MRIVLAIAALVLMVLPASAQMGGTGAMGGKHNHHGRPQMSETPKKKADDKDYKAALEHLPDRKADPWADRH